MSLKEQAGLRRPHGLAEIMATFGNIYEYISVEPSGRQRLNPAFESTFLATIALPFPLRLSWDAGKQVMVLRCHRRTQGLFSTVFRRILAEGLNEKITTFGGCFNFRLKKSGQGLSTHCWGIAIDLNPSTNRPGTEGDMDENIVSIFEDFGFIWGGRWPGNTKDPMHFQFCSGY